MSYWKPTFTPKLSAQETAKRSSDLSAAISAMQAAEINSPEELAAHLEKEAANMGSNNPLAEQRREQARRLRKGGAQ